MNDFIRIAQAQINATLGDFTANTNKIIRFIQDARDHNSDIVTFPELAVCGYPPEDLLLKPSFLHDNLKAVETIREHTQDIAVVVGFAAFEKEKRYSAAALIYDKVIQGIYYKIELPNYGVFDEKRYFSKGKKGLIVKAGRTKITINICEDIWVKNGAVKDFTSKNDIDLVLNISASPFHANKLSERENVAIQFARDTKTYLCLNNLVGGQDELVFDGGSFVIDQDGNILSRAKRFQEDLLITDIPQAGHSAVPFEGKDLADFGTSTYQKPPIERETITIPVHTHEHKKAPRKHPGHNGTLDEIYHALVLGTRDYVKKNGFKTVVIGLSGGIDSSLTAAIAVDALGKDRVVGVTMPSIYTSNATLSDAEILSKNLDIRLITIPIKGLHRAYMETLEPVIGRDAKGVVYENIQARIRGNLLMALSNNFGWLVLTTGNKSELAVGYCTLYGDMAGGFAVIKDVPKTLVFKLAEHVNTAHKREIIPESIITRPPSAELRPDQKDEDSLPPYPILDGILRAYVEEDKSFQEITEAGYDPDTVRRVLRLVDLNEYKRRQAPLGIKITPRAFGKDRRLPVTNRYMEYQNT